MKLARAVLSGAALADMENRSDAVDCAAELSRHVLAQDAEIERLKARQQELLATIVRVTNETPFPDEMKGWESQRAALLAEVGTLRAALREACAMLADVDHVLSESETDRIAELRKLAGE